MRSFTSRDARFTVRQLATPSGRAKFTVHDLPPLRGDGDQLRLMTVRSEGQFNTIVYEEGDLYRGQDRHAPIILMEPGRYRSAATLKVDQPVTVRSTTGSLSGILVRAFDVRGGNALMYFPEANMLVPTTTDPASKTPAFKSVLVRIEPVRSPSRKSSRGGVALGGCAWST